MTSPGAPEPASRRSALGLWGPAVVLCVLMAAAALPLIIAGNDRGRGAFDSVNFHIPVARMFAREFPRADLSDYNVTTTPGYHLLLAAAVRAGVDSTTGLRAVTLVFALALIATLARACAGWGGPLLALACCLPVVCSPYVFQSGAWALPDDLAWWGVLGVLLLAVSPRFGGWWLLAGGAVLVCLVLVRQVQVWAAAMLWAAAWIGPAPRDERWVALTRHLAGRSRRAALALGASLPMFAALGWFLWTWGGLTPPTFQGMYHGVGWSAPCLILALLGVFSVFFAGYLAPALPGLWRRHSGLVLLSGAAGFVLAVLPTTTESPALPGYRNSGLWHAAGVLGVVGDRTSVLMVLLSVGGAVAAAAWGAALSFRDRWIMGAGLVAFMAAQAASPMVWQRYNEPFLLIACAACACRIPRAGGRGTAAARVLGPVALGVALAGLTAWIITTSEPTVDYHLDPRTGQAG